MRIICFTILFIDVSGAFIGYSTMSNNYTNRNIFIKTINKSRITRCSPKLIKPLMKRIAPAWSLRDMYGSDYRSNTKDKSDRSAKPLTTHKQLITKKKELPQHIPCTGHTITESATEKVTVISTTEIPQSTIMKHSKYTEIRPHFFLLTTTLVSNNYQQKKSRKLQALLHRRMLKKTKNLKKNKKTPLKITNITKTQNDKEINFMFLPKFHHEYDDADKYTNYKTHKVIDQMNIHYATNNYGKRTLPRYNKTRNIPTTPSTTTNASTAKEIFDDIIKTHMKDLHVGDISVVKRYNHHHSSMHTTSSWKKNKGVKRIPTTLKTGENMNAKFRLNTCQSNNTEYYQRGHVVDTLKHVLLNYDISRRPEQRRNSLQKFGLAYVPVPLKLKARYNYLNHFTQNPRMQALLSNYGYYLPGSLGIRRFGIYNWAYKPLGAIYRNIIEPDPEYWYK